jgi:hypothetical protein
VDQEVLVDQKILATDVVLLLQQVQEDQGVPVDQEVLVDQKVLATDVVLLSQHVQ